MKIERKRRRGRIPKQLVYGFKEKRKYWNFKEKALDCTLRIMDFGTNYGLVAWYKDDECISYLQDLRC